MPFRGQPSRSGPGPGEDQAKGQGQAGPTFRQWSIEGKGDRMNDLIELRNIHKTYHLGEVDLPVLKGVSLEVAKGRAA